MRLVRRHPATAAVAVALAAVVVAGQLASVAHLVLVRHVTCAEHGELIDVGHAHAAAVAPARPHATTVADSSSAESHGHDHCLLAPIRRERVVFAAQPIAGSLHVDAYATTGRTRDVEVAPPIPLILLAPKSSPPLV